MGIRSRLAVLSNAFPARRFDFVMNLQRKGGDSFILDEAATLPSNI